MYGQHASIRGFKLSKNKYKQIRQDSSLARFLMSRKVRVVESCNTLLSYAISIAENRYKSASCQFKNRNMAV